MERLLYSSSPTALKISPRPSPFLSRLGRFDSPKVNFLPSLTQPQLRRVISISCKTDNPSQFSSPQSNPSNELPSLLSPRLDSANGSTPSFNFLKLIAIGASAQRKASHGSAVVICFVMHCIAVNIAITAGTFIALSAIVMFLIQPIFAPAAFATLQTAAKTSGTAAAAVGGRVIRGELLSSAWTGFFAGCLHTLSGPDHLAALAPLSIGRTRMESAVVGALWGCGHDAGQVIFGLLFLLLKDRLHVEVIRTWGTRVVGLTLLAIGAMGIREASEVPAPCVALENVECDVSVYETLENPAVGKKKLGFATFATGIIHGLQPDALMMVLPALALPSRLAGAAFLIMFLLGTVVAMGCYTVFIGSCSQALKDRVPRITEKLTWASSLVAIALGIAILVSQFFGYSLY
ncbi:High-affinity nickel-transport family protein [Theobroma cacao]|uniref:High-affinity nickel-transport family protein n=1 Tax=Theobroma cacao TaxID=3641 RepID=A0A061DY68_THECC|nr:High-affinity nickel-transport family protein [Theobroma cacao]